MEENITETTATATIDAPDSGALQPVEDETPKRPGHVDALITDVRACWDHGNATALAIVADLKDPSRMLDVDPAKRGPYVDAMHEALDLRGELLAADVWTQPEEGHELRRTWDLYQETIHTAYRLRAAI